MSDLKQTIYLRQSSSFGPWVECEKSHPDAVAFERRTEPEATAPAQDLSAAILAIELPAPDPYCASKGIYGFTAQQMRDLLKAAAALASSANALSAGDSQKALDALLTRIDDAFEAYERYGGICEFEGNPMIYADTLTEIVTLRGDYHATLQSQKAK